MQTCIVCNRPVGFFSRKRLSDGAYLCPDCLKLLPSPIRYGQYADAIDAVSGAEYGKIAREEWSRQFSATAHYGRMFLDERNGFFVICDATAVGKDGKLRYQTSDIYYCLAVGNAGFTAEEVSHTTSRVMCRVIFEGNLLKFGPGIRIHEAIKKQASVPLLYGNNGMASWSEPADLNSFRCLYEQMVSRELQKLESVKEKEEEKQARLKEERERKAREEAYRRTQEERRRESENENGGMDIAQAKALFMVGADYTAAKLKKQRALLMKTFHPDSGNVESSEYAGKINKAYEILYQALKNKEEEGHETD